MKSRRFVTQGETGKDDEPITEETMSTMELIERKEFSDDVYELTPDEKRRIEAARRRLDAGQGICGEEARRRIDECLKRLAKDFP